MERQKKSRLCMGIQARILALAILFTLLTAGIIVITSTISLSAQMRRSVLQSAEYALQTSSAAIRQDIQEVDDLARWCRVDSTVRTAMLSNISPGILTNTLYPVISNKYNSMHTAPYIQRFLMHGSNTRTIMMGTAASQSVYLDHDNIRRFPGLEEGAPPTQWEKIIPDPMMQSGIRLDSIPIFNTISSGDNSFSAVIYFSVSPALITDQLKDFSLEDGAWLCWIMGGQFYRIQGSSFTPLGPVERLPEANATDTLDGGTLLYETEIGGSACSVVLCPLDTHGLYLGEVIPQSRFSHPATLLRGPALASLIAVLTMGLIIAALLRRVVAVPIKALQQQIERISQGDFSVNPDIEWDHELGSVGRGINHLSLSVSELMAHRVEDEQQRLALEYRMLQNQISPHFIYNTLNSIKWMATIQKAPGVAEMATALSRLLKNVSKGTQKLTSLQEEFALLEDYFTIQRYRYGGTITLEMPVLEDDSLISRYRIPRFTLQPLAENAIFHGIEPKGGVGRVSVTLEADSKSGDLLVHLSDDGIGMEPEQIRELLSGDGLEDDNGLQFRRLGVWSVHRLLQLSFGQAYGLSIQSTPGKGTTITMRLPEQTV